MKTTTNEQFVELISASQGAQSPAKGNIKAASRKAARREEDDTLVDNGVVEDALLQAQIESLDLSGSGQILLAQADTAKVAETGGAGASAASSEAAASAATATTAATATAGLGWGSILLGGLAVGGLAAAAGGGSSGGGSSGGGSSGGTAVAAQTGGVVSGQIVAGPVIAGHGLSVKVYDLAGNELGTASVDSHGRFTVNVGAYTGGIVAKVFDANDGKDFRDEASGINKDINAVLMAVDVVVTANAAVTMNINAATTAAAVKAGLSAADGSGTVTGATVADKIATIQGANTAVATAAGLTGSLTGTAAIPVINANGSDNTANANSLGKFLAAMSGVDKTNGGDMAATIASLASGITGAGTNAVLDAATQSLLIAGAANAGVSTAAFTAIIAPNAGAAATALGNALDAGQVAALTPTIAANLTQAQVQSIGDVTTIPLAALGAISPAVLAAALDANKIALLTGPQLGALSDAQATAIGAAGGFDNLNPVQVAALAASAIDSVPAGVIDDLSAAQVAALSTPKLAALTSDQAAAIGAAGGFANLSNAQVAAIGASAIDSVPAGVMDNLSAAQVAALSNAQLAALTSDQTAAIGAAGGFASLTNAQVAALDANAIDSVPAAVIDNLSAVQVAALSNAQLAALTSDQAAAIGAAGGFANLSVAQVLQLAAGAIDSVPATLINTLSTAQVEGLSNGHVQSLAPVLTVPVAAKLTAAQVQSITDVSVIPAAAIAAIPASVLATLSVSQLGNLGTTQLQNLSADQVVALANAGKLAALSDIAALGEKVASLDANTLGSLDAGQLAGLSQGQISAIAAAGKLTAITDFASLGTDIVALTPAQLASLNNTQLAALNVAQITALGDAGKLSALAVDLLANPAINQIGALGDDIAGLTAGALASLSASQLEGLTAAQIGLLASATPSALTSLNATQIAALGTDITGLSELQVKALDAQQLAGITSAQADALAVAGKLVGLTASEIILLSGAAIDAIPTNNITQLSAAQVNDLSDTQLLGLTKDQITALANANKLSALTAGKIAAIGNDINGISAAQLALLGDDQLGGLTKGQLGALAGDGDLAQLTGAKLRAVGADINGLSAAQAALLTDPQLTDLDAVQLAALAADGDLASLIANQITALGTDITGLTPAQLSALSVAQLGGIDATQAAALAAAGDFASFTATNIKALSAAAIASLPANVLLNLGAEVANLTLAQVQALTAAQLTALNTAGLLDDITHPLISTQVSGAAPAGLGLTAVDSADKLALFNSAVQSASGTTALDLSALAGGAAAVCAAVNGGPLTVANLQALGLANVSEGNIAAIKAKIDATSSGTDASLVDSLTELKAIVANASGKLADGYVNAAEATGNVDIAVALPSGAQVGQSISLTLPGSGGAADQTITRNLTQLDLDAGYAVMTVSTAQITASGQGSKALTASINGGGAFAVDTLVLDTDAPSVLTLTPVDGASLIPVANLVLVFNGAISKGSGNIRLVDDTAATTTTIAVSSNEISISGSTLTINPASDLTVGHAYHIEIDAGAITDLAGNAHAGIAGATTWNVQVSALQSTVDAIATDNKVNIVEAASPVVISGTVSAIAAAAGAIADLQQSDFTVTLVPRGGGVTVTSSLVSYTNTTGVWSCKIGADALADGKTYDVTVSISGTNGAAAGLTTMAYAVVGADLTAPNAPAITSVTDDVGTILGAVASDGDSDDTAPVVRVSLTGTQAAAGDAVQIYNGGSALGSQQVLTALHLINGYVDLPLTGLANGTSYTLTARVIDACGNPSEPSAIHVLNIDTAIPTLTVSNVSLSADTAGPNHGTSTDLNTSTAAQTISATLSGSGLASGDKLYGSLNNGASWTDITDKVAGNSITWTGAVLAGSSHIVFKIADRAGNEGNATGATAYVLDTANPVFSSGAAVSVAENSTAAYNAQTTEGDTGMYYTLTGGADQARFTIDNATGQVSFVAGPDFEAPVAAGGNNVYDFTVRATDLAGHFTEQAVALTVTDVNPTSAQLFGLWESDGWGGGGTATTTGALQAMGSEIVNQRAVTSADGMANGSSAMSQYINRVTGSDIVSDAEFDAGFSISGKAATGQAGNIKFYLDNNRTNGVNEIGTELVNNSNGVTIVYDNATGDYSISFAANSEALLQATHNTYGSGVHQLTVDTNGNGSKDTGEASRLFLVASGTAQTTDTGLVTKNYSVQDKVTGDVFVYYYGDPDANGIGLWTQMDKGDSASNIGMNNDNRDADGNGLGDWDYYNTTGVAFGTPSTTGNTALGFVTNIQAQVWEFHMGKTSASSVNYNSAASNAGDHTLWNSNTSRLGSLEEVLALYAANFGGDTGGGGAASNTVGAVQPMTDSSSLNGQIAAEDNRPGGWAYGIWSSAPTPSGHAFILIRNGDVRDLPDGTSPTYVSAVL